MNKLTCFLNGQFIPLSEAGLPVNDLGVQRGYGIFDFLRIANNIPLYWDDHLDRFFHSAQEMRLPVSQTKDDFTMIITQLLQKNNLPNSGVRIMLSGGISPDGYQIIEPNLVIVQQPLIPPSDQINQKGYKLASYPHQRQMPHVKTTDYLMAIWLQPWVKERKADDILYHQNEIVSECPRSSFFIVTKEKKIVTPGRNILKGITRKQVLGLAINNGMMVEERDVSLEDIRYAKEAFIASSTKRIIPVMQVDDIVFDPCTKESVSWQLFDLLLSKEKEITGRPF